jgi:cellulose synthase/poly-beta-1,6-N-acetylglucosamine synthase-like glycosyltransferase
LKALLALDYPQSQFEVIVVDDGSQDETPTLLKEFAATTTQKFTYQSQSNRGPAAARNAGARLATGELLAFTDDDCAPEPAWLSALANSFTDDKVGGSGGPIRDVSHNTISNYLGLHHVVASKLSNDDIPPYLITANACYRRDCFLAVNGFDERIRHPGGEDPDLSWRIMGRGYTLSYCPEAAVRHYHKTGLIEFIRAYYYYGQGFHYVQRKYQLQKLAQSARQGLARALSPLMFAYRIKQYVQQHHLNWQQALAYALLDHVSGLAWQCGYLSLKLA